MTLTSDRMPSSNKQPLLWNVRFVAVNAIMFLTFCNMAVFFQFYDYLHSLGLPSSWIGPIIGIFALTALLIRPFISPWLNAGNARRWIFISCLAVMGSLGLYNFALGAWSLLLVRIIHGGAYVVLATATVSALVGSIPPARSGQAFGIMAVVTLLPYAVLPPLVEGLINQVGGYVNMLNLTALLMAPILLLCRLLTPSVKQGEKSDQDRLSRKEIWDNLRNPRVRALLGASLLVFTAFAPVFFFVKSFAGQIGVANPGWFFTISTGMEVGVRLIGGTFFDRANKHYMLSLSLALLVCTYTALALTKGPTMFFSLAALMGLGWGVALPMINSLLFDLSPPRLRAFNANLGFEMFQGGLFLGPWLGAWLLAQTSYLVLFLCCAASLATAFLLTPLLRPKK